MARAARTGGDGLTVTGVRGLAQVLGVGKTRAAALTREPWFPAKGPDGTWSVSEVKRAVSLHNGGPAAPAEALAPAELSETDRKLIEVLETSTDKLEIARAAVPLAARRFARTHNGDVLAAGKTASDLARTLEELRRQEADIVELSEKTGSLIEREIARATMAALAKRFVLACERLEVRIASQLELWLADEKFRALSSEERGREARAWTAQQTKYARIAEVEEGLPEIDRMIEAEFSMRRRK